MIFDVEGIELQEIVLNEFAKNALASFGFVRGSGVAKRSRLASLRPLRRALRATKRHDAIGRYPFASVSAQAGVEGYRNEAKDEPEWGCVAGARDAVCGWEIILFIWAGVWQVRGGGELEFLKERI